MLILDTSAVIRLLRHKNKEDIQDLLHFIQDQPYLVTAFTVYELLRGAQPHELPVLRTFLDHTHIISFERVIAEQSATLECTLRESGKTFAPLDLFIAATCLLIDGTLLTLDKQFTSIPQLSVRII